MNNNTESAARLYRVLYAYALRLTCGNKYIADGLVAETLTRIKKRGMAYPATIVSFTIWARMVMKNAFHETVPDADKRELYYLFYYGSLNPIVPVWDGAHGLREQINIMSRLTPQQAAAMTLLLNGYSLDVIASEMNVSVECVKSHLVNARLAMMRTYGD